MAEKRDLLDEIIDIQQDWNALSHTGDELVEQLAASPEDVPVFDPADYLERPRANSTYCVVAASRDPRACDRCLRVCPVDAIGIQGATVRIADTCRRCDLCAAVCPTEVFQLRTNDPLALYEKIARIATAYEQCYVTCALALDRMPMANEVVLPCVGAASREVWFDLLCEFPNLSVYLPLDACERCHVVTGEEALADAVADAEAWSGESVGLEVDERELGREQKRAYKRSQFVSGMTQAGTRLVSRSVPVLAGAQAVARRLQEHSKRIGEMQQSLEKAVGAQNSNNRRRVLTRNRRLLMAGLQRYPDLAEDMTLAFPQIDESRCTMCGDCAKVCTVRAMDIDKSGRLTLESTYCVNCGACAVACPEGAIDMQERTVEDLVLPDKKALERERQRAHANKLKKQGEQRLKAGLDALERLADK